MRFGFDTFIFKAAVCALCLADEPAQLMYSRVTRKRVRYPVSSSTVLRRFTPTSDKGTRGRSGETRGSGGDLVPDALGDHLSFPKIPSGLDSRCEAESSHHSDRCLRSMARWNG